MWSENAVTENKHDDYPIKKEKIRNKTRFKEERERKRMYDFKLF